MSISRYGLVALSLSLVGAVSGTSACDGGGSAAPEDRCAQFMNLTAECYARAGETRMTNSAACGNAAALDPRTLAQIDCALASRDAYCRTITAAVSRDAGGISATDPEIVRLNACTMSGMTASPCKEAILTLADCGVAIGFLQDCSGQSGVSARCITENPKGACALYAKREPGAALPPEAQTFQQCQLVGTRALLDAGR